MPDWRFDVKPLVEHLARFAAIIYVASQERARDTGAGMSAGEVVAAVRIAWVEAAIDSGADWIDDVRREPR